MNRTQSVGLEVRSEDTVSVILPAPARIFEKRSARFRSLAPGHALGTYLEVMARLAEAQRMASQATPPGGRLISLQSLPFDLNSRFDGELWRRVLGIIVSEMRPVPIPERSRAALDYLTGAHPAELEYSARAMMSGNHIDRATSAFIAASLQVYWTSLASRVQAGAVKQPAHSCPVCASPPVGGIVLSGRKLRYLCCSLCGTQWHVPRLACVNCGSTAGISYFTVNEDETGAKAEACSRCNTYLKLFYMESNPQAETFADDLASLALDLLMSNEGYSRNGINLFML